MAIVTLVGVVVVAAAGGLIALRLTRDWTPPAPVEGLSTAAPGAGVLDLRWRAPAVDQGVTAYQVLRDGVEIGFTDLPRYLDTAAATGGAHRYQVVALDVSGNASQPGAGLVLTVPAGSGVAGVAGVAGASTRVQPLFASDAHLAAMAERVRRGLQPQASAWRVTAARAAEVLTAREQDLAEGRPPTVCDHENGCALWAQPPYSTDGVYDKDRDRGDYQTAFRLSEDLVTLAVAWRITGDRRYADLAHRLLVSWTVNPATAMLPLAWNSNNPPSGPASQAIDVFLTVPGILYGASLIWDAGEFSTEEQAAVARWARAIALDGYNRRHYDNNFDAWRLTLVMAGASLSGDTVLMNAAARDLAAAVVAQITPDGVLRHEIRRTRSLHYSAFALNGFLQAGLIAQEFGLDLPDDTATGLRLRAAVNRLAPYLSTPTAWTQWSQATGYTELGPIRVAEELVPLELAHRRWGARLDPSVAAGLRGWGRPVVDPRAIGPVTLTHGVP